MKVTQTLIHEHQLILSALGLLRRAVFEKYEALAEDLCRIFPPG